MLPKNPFPNNWYIPANIMYNQIYTLLDTLSSGRYRVDKHSMENYLTQMGDHLENIAVSIDKKKNASTL